jgi:hypothetical protein
VFFEGATTFSTTTLSLMTLYIKGIPLTLNVMTLGIISMDQNAEYNNMVSHFPFIMLNVVMLNVIMLNVMAPL